ncbi:MULTISPECIES: DNA ligase [Pseudomonas]|uniref:DNA ligase n=1 Tax=Pseudomonas abyssi TaxID=170540 RepID=A0A2A3MN81_9PSED|nr:DNA ligase [Pseudomonas abyssi]MAC98783.1 DNA ligase [Pseudomonadales bacterium]PBK06280.1 DNA ligase [Pseudomonas abyssi]
MRGWKQAGLALMLLVVQASPAQQAGLQLAQSYRDEVAVEQYWISEKLDGVRGRWDGEQLLTRGGYPVRVPDWFTQGWPAYPMDGELWLGRGRFAQISALVRSSDVPEQAWRHVRFMVFDLPEHGGPFSERVAVMAGLTALGSDYLLPVQQSRLPNSAALARELERVVALGGEGLMLHHQSARYHAGRSDALLKYKLHDDAEAFVVGYTAGQGKYAGQVGALIVEDEQGRRFRLGSGLSDADRVTPPALGSRVTYRYNGLTAGGMPRFARYLRERPVSDE